MPALQLPRAATHHDLIAGLHNAGVLGDPGWTKLAIHAPENLFISTAAIAFLAAWGKKQVQDGRRIEFFGSRRDLNYLSRLDLFQHLDFNSYEEQFERHPEAGRFTPILLVEDEDSVMRASNAICDLVLSQFDNAREFLPAMEWSVYEIVDNIRLHSETLAPGVVVAQYFPQRTRLDIAICDTGRGIFESLSQSRKLWSHGDAITKALQRGVTRDPDVGQGNGLAGSLEIVKSNGGGLELWTGNANFRVIRGEEKGFTPLPEVEGTGVFLQLDTRHPVDLESTFIGDAGWSYINVVAEQISEEGSIRIIEHCHHTASRETATPVRRKIEAMLPEMADALTLDFSSVEMASSSFLDELLGRLVKGLGQERFANKVRIVNLEQSLAAMANVVIAQRLQGG
jgi:hypothetical protein